MSYSSESLVNLDTHYPIWERFFTVAPLVIIGTKETDGSYDLAPKHLAMPLGWDNYFGFVCHPRHHTYQNIVREGVFTVSLPKPTQLILTSLSASPRCENEQKTSLAALPTFPATVIDGVFLENAYLYLECQLEKIIDGFGENSLITSKILAAKLPANVLRQADVDDQDLIAQIPLLVYLSPGRYSVIERSYSFPFPVGFQK